MLPDAGSIPAASTRHFLGLLKKGLRGKFLALKIFKEVIMSQEIPAQYRRIQERFKDYHEAVSRLGEAVRKGPLDEKTIQLVQLAASAAIRSEGAVHSHTRRALQAGATEDEIYHALLVITSTVGFPTVSAALSWVDDVLKK